MSLISLSSMENMMYPLPGNGKVWLSKKKTKFLYGAICVFYVQS